MSSIYYSVRVSRILLCDCLSYKFHHSVGNGLCSSVAPVDLQSIPFKISRTAKHRASLILKDKFF